jgi:hypothetical protein
MSAAAQSSPSDIAGYVEATTATRVLGWAWSPGAPEHRVQVQVRLGDSVLVEGSADREREDLARNGIGDGRHAFELHLPASARDRLAELRVLVRAPGGEWLPLGVPAPADGTAERLDRLQRAVDALIGSQRLLHRNVQAALTAPREAAQAPDFAAITEHLSKQMATLELFVMRLDERMAGASSGHLPASEPRVSRGALAAFAVATLALAVSLWGLWRQLS